MRLTAWFKRSARRDDVVRCFAQDVDAAGGVLSAVDRGYREVDTDMIVGSVGRSRELRHDFSHRVDGLSSARFRRVAEAMSGGQALPPLELYKIVPRGRGATPGSRYYVVDGHHRVAAARRLGQAALDAHVVEYRVAR